MRQTHAFVGAVAAVATVLFSGAAFAQSDAARLDRLERDMQILQQQMGRAGPAPSGASATAPTAGGGSAALVQMEMRISAIESQMREMNGRIEELGLKLNQIDKTLDKKFSDAEFRLKTLEDAQRGSAEGKAPEGKMPGATVSAAPGVPPGTKPIAPMPAPGSQQASAPPAASSAPMLLPPGTPDEQFKFAFDFLKQNDYAQGERAMRAFADAHPNHPLTGNALFWLGQMYFVNKDYTKSAVSFAQSYEKFPDGSKAPESLQKLGVSLAQLNKKDEACTAFKQFQTQYPTAPVATKQSVQAESVRLGCK
ncbi:MAG: tol-pal system protein YbgF [Alphaproteobacteria bacterium]